MQFQKHRYYRHNRMVDVCFYVLEVIEQTQEGTRLNIEWFHTYYGYPLGLVEPVIVKTEQYPNYREYAVH